MAVIPLRMAVMSALALTAACTTPVDFDFRSIGNGFDTSESVRNLAERPMPDNRGVISYPGYQVAVARRGDTAAGIAARLGLDAAALARFNGMDTDTPLRRGEIVALPARVAEPSPATGAAGTGPLRSPDVAVTALDAINRAEAAGTGRVATAAVPQTGREPIRHQVERGETAFTVARLYNVPVESLAEWNGLGPDFAVREGQFLLIPVEAVTAQIQPTANAVSQPGDGTDTPTPPSATTPLPDEDPNVTAPTADPPQQTPPPQDLATERTSASASDARFVRPADGNIIRAYARGRNDGIDIGAPAGAEVRAADSGTVAAVSQDTNGITILVIRHQGGLLTVYTNVDNLTVERGDSVTLGQKVAEVRDASPSFVHFQVRRGLESVDPGDFLP